MNVRKIIFRLSGIALNALSALAPRAAGRLAMRLFGRPHRRLYSASDRELFSKARGSFRFQSGGRAIQAYCWALPETSETAPAVLLLHGWESHSGRWDFLIPALANAGYRVYAMDAPAHGRSEGTRANMLIYAEAVRALIRREGAMQAVIGHSLGGAAAVAAFADLPPAEHPAKMVVMGAFDRTERVIGDFAQNLNLGRRVVKGLHREIERLTGHPISHFSVARMAAGLRTRGLVIHDRRDAIVPFAEGEAIAQAMLEAEFMPTDELGHGLKHEQVVRRIGQFLRD